MRWTTAGAAVLVALVGLAGCVGNSPAGGSSSGPQANAGPGASSARAAVPRFLGQYAINVVSARSIGCSDDVPDLWVAVRMNGAVVLKATSEDASSAVYGAYVTVADPGDLTVDVTEDEGSGQFSACDADSGPDVRATVPWHGEDKVVDLVGNDRNAATVHLVLGRLPVDAPAAEATSTGTDGWTLSWPTPAGTLQQYQLADTEGHSVGSMPATSHSVAVAGLCDGQAYSVRLLAASGSWLLGDPITVTTRNGPPRPVMMLGAERSGRVSWSDFDGQHIDRYEVHAGPIDFVPSAQSLRATAKPFGIYWDQSASVQWKPDDAQVLVRSIEPDGQAANSPGMAVGTPTGHDSSRMAQRACNPSWSLQAFAREDGVAGPVKTLAPGETHAIRLTATPSNVTAGDLVVVAIDAGEGTGGRWMLDFGDGQWAASAVPAFPATVAHAYRRPGSYALQLDAHFGNQVEGATVPVVVLPAPPPRPIPIHVTGVLDLGNPGPADCGAAAPDSARLVVPVRVNATSGPWTLNATRFQANLTWTAAEADLNLRLLAPDGSQLAASTNTNLPTAPPAAVPGVSGPGVERLALGGHFRPGDYALVVDACRGSNVSFALDGAVFVEGT